MEIKEIKTIFESLEEIYTFSKCQNCNNNNNIRARIKICGHYFCEQCVKNINQKCPKCKILVKDKDVDWDNMFVKTKDILSNIHDCLVQALKTNESVKTKISNYRFIYQHKTYQLNFIDDEKVNAKGETALHVACKKKNLKNVKNLLEKQVDINAQDFAGWTPLHEAIQSKSYEIVELLLKHGALTDIPGEDYITPIHKAVVCEDTSIITLLLQYGANKEPIDYYGRKPLDCIKNYKDIEQLFKEKINLINRISQLYLREKMVAYCYYVQPIYVNKLKQNKIKVEEEYNAKKVTHFIIKKTHKVSVKILMAMLEGCKIVPQEYIDDFLKGDIFIPIPDYTFIDLPVLNKGIQKAVINSLLKVPKLFDGINFYITAHFSPVLIHNLKIQKSNLVNLINSGGGKVLHRAPTPSTCEEKVLFPFHASKTHAKCCNYIIYEEEKPPLLMYHMPELKHKSSNWLFECAIQFTLLD